MNQNIFNKPLTSYEKKILARTLYPPPKKETCSQCGKEIVCCFTQLLGWICPKCDEKLTPRISGD